MNIVISRSWLVFCVIVSFSIPFNYAQHSPVFKISSFRYNFGVISSGAGKLTHVFPVENPGGDTLRVLKIKSSAENINGSFEPEKIAPGGKGKIILSFDPSDEKGKVEKFVSIRTNDPQNPIRQFGVMADVIPSPAVSPGLFPVVMGNLRLKTKHLVMDKILSTEQRTDTFKIYNAGTRAMTFQVINPPDYTTWQTEPTKLDPGKEGRIIITYDAARAFKFGSDLESFTILTNDSLEKEKNISLGINILEDFSYLKGNPSKRAKAYFSSTAHSFGDIRAGDIVECYYTIENRGKANLIIRRTKAGCGCTVAELEKKILQPGEKTRLKVRFDSHGMTGQQSKAVTVICNDPDNAVTLLTFTANIMQ